MSNKIGGIKDILIITGVNEEKETKIPKKSRGQ